MWGEYYMRTASSLDAKRVKTDPAFRPLMEYAAILSCASRIASEIYRLLPAKGRRHALYRTITGEAMGLLKQGILPEEVGEQLLRQHVLPKVSAKKAGSFRADKPVLLFHGFSFAGEYYALTIHSVTISPGSPMPP